jgi:uncharacterized protein YndB with AHSA1/START domain
MTISRNGEEPIEAREIVITRVIDAPANVLFEAYANPEHVKKWFGPKGYPLTLCEMDFRVGGRFRFAMTGPSGKQNTPFGGEYLEIVPNRKIVFDNGFELPGAERMIVTYTYEEVDGKTRFTIHTLFSSVEAKNYHVGAGFEIGYNSAIDQLETVANQMKAEIRS